MPEFAEHIEITDSGLKINGEDFPWYIAQGGVSLSGGEGMEILTLKLITGRVVAPASDDQPGTTGCTCAEPGGGCSDYPTGPLARAEAARDQAESALASAQRALEDNDAVIKGLRSDLAQTKRALKASQYRARKAETRLARSVAGAPSRGE